MGIKVSLIAIAVALFIIGVHQSFYYGVQNSYWAFMISGFCYLGFEYLKRKEKEKEPSVSSKTEKKATKPHKKKK